MQLLDGPGLPAHTRRTHLAGNLPMIVIDRRAFFAFLGGAAVVARMTPEARADGLESFLAANIGAAAASAVASRPPTVAELEAQVPTRSFRRGVGNGMVNKDGG